MLKLIHILGEKQREVSVSFRSHYTLDTYLKYLILPAFLRVPNRGR